MLIRKVPMENWNKMLELYQAVIAQLRKQGLDQWDEHYPSGEVIRDDLIRGCLFGLKEGQRWLGAIAIDDSQADEYKTVDWLWREEPVMCIHRLAVHPEAQGRGYAKKLIAFAEELARKRQAKAIRLDTYSLNAKALALYLRLGYQPRGTVMFPRRKAPFICMEKYLF